MMIKLRDVVYQMFTASFKKYLGRIYYDRRQIFLKRGVTGEPELDVLIHEMLHGCLPDMREDVITESSNSISAVLWKLGYRKTDDGEQLEHANIAEKRREWLNVKEDTHE